MMSRPSPHSILSRLGKVGERVVRVAWYAGFMLYPALILCVLYEVIARYGFNAPTIWAFDITFMVHGALFMMTGAYALQINAHVRIDVLSTRLPRSMQHAANIISYVFLVLPGVWIFADAAVRRAYSSYVTGEVELVSAWGPLVWPFFIALALGLVVLWLQSFIETVRHMIGVFTGQPLVPSDVET